MTEATYTAAGLDRRGRMLILAGVFALAVIGYFVGLRAGVPEGRPGMQDAARAVEIAPPTEDVYAAMSYADVGAGRLRSRRASQTWESMTAALRAAEKKPVTDVATRGLSLDVRAQRRAFNGAPPVIPHDSLGLDDKACLACHGKELAIGDRVARALPHAHLINCRQCHAPQGPAIFQDLGGLLAKSSWEGVAAPREGPRATPGAPPAVPHTLHMRDNCMACHGSFGWPGMQTSHPERSACLQCHAPTHDRAHPGKSLASEQFLPPPKIGQR